LEEYAGVENRQLARIRAHVDADQSWNGGKTRTGEAPVGGKHTRLVMGILRS
jgi:hypothetical protein